LSTYLLVPDQHAHPDHNNDRADWVGELLVDLKPDVVVNMGDAADMASLSDYDKGKRSFHGRAYKKDIEAHLDFQERMWAPLRRQKKKLPRRIVLEGNHEHRIWKHLDDPNALISKCANDTAKHLRSFIRDELKARYVDTYNINASWLRLGPFLLGHGWMHGEHAARDHAQLMGNCIIGHTHSFSSVRGKVATGATGISVGMLANGEALTYAHQRAATSKWTTSFLSCEYDDNRLHFTPHILKESMSPVFEKI